MSQWLKRVHVVLRSGKRRRCRSGVARWAVGAWSCEKVVLVDEVPKTNVSCYSGRLKVRQDVDFAAGVDPDRPVHGPSTVIMFYVAWREQLLGRYCIIGSVESNGARVDYFRWNTRSDL